MNIDFHSEALQFMEKNGCKKLVPLEIVKKAMEHGASIVVEHATQLVEKAHSDLVEKRARGNRPN